MTEPTPMTIVEQLDAARSGGEFGQALQGLFRALERARDDELGGREA